MTEEELADLLAQHLDTVLEGGTLPLDLPAEVAELLVVAQNLSDAAPTPRPEFGPALKGSLLNSAGDGNGAVLPAKSAFGGPTVISVIVIALLVGAALVALVVSVTILGFIQTGQEATPPSPLQTRAAPVSPTALPVTPSPLSESSPTLAATSPITEPAATSQATLIPTATVTPIIDVLPAITVTTEIPIEPPSLAPGSGGGGGSGNGNSGGGGSSGGGGGDGRDDDDGDD